MPPKTERPVALSSGRLAPIPQRSRILVRAKGLEPPRLASPEPKSGASTSSATPASKPPKRERPQALGALYINLPALRQRKNGGCPAEPSDCARRRAGALRLAPVLRQGRGRHHAAELDDVRGDGLDCPKGDFNPTVTGAEQGLARLDLRTVLAYPAPTLVGV
jgi:hypothetical protein